MPKEIQTDSALKNLFDRGLLQRISNSIAAVYPEFDQKSFISLMPQLKSLEMKSRVYLIRDELRKKLPLDFPKALTILIKSTEKNLLSGFDLWPYMEFIQTYGLEHCNLSLEALKKITGLFTAEWAIRPFIKKYPKQTMEFLLKCAKDSDVNVRRWASEGTRPRLPWGERLQEFIRNPEPTLAILDQLKFDEELYVRKSVSNHLNDIAKDHPDYVIKILKRWQKEAGQAHVKKNIEWIVRRSLRTLIKDGHSGALSLIGVSSDVKVKIIKFSIKKTKIKLGEKIDFEFQIQSHAGKSQKLVIDYLIHFVKANSKTAPKVFKLKTFELKSKEVLKISKSHKIKKITTREYYSGRHLLEIQVNGKIIGKIPWHLTVQ